MPSISIIVPTKNESENICPLLDSLSAHMVEFDYEVVVVDDSDDNRTMMLAAMNGARIIAGQHKGLGQAIIDGIQGSSGDIVLVMDADLSHRPQDINKLLEPILKQSYDMSIGSRYVKGGECVGWSWHRKIISFTACLLAFPITHFKDNTSGFFAFRKNIVDKVTLKPDSWKIMLEVMLKARPIRVIEVPIVFVPRFAGKSKFSAKQMIVYLKHIILLAFWKYQRFVKFAIVGGTGVVITFVITWFGTEVFGLWYMASLAIAVVVTLITNFTFNSLWTFKLAEDPTVADYEWRSFYKGNLIQKWWKQKIAKTVWDYVPNASLLLDAGCGSSPIITHYPNAVAIDTNEDKLNFMKEKFPSAVYNKVQVEKMLFVSNAFDHILCIEVLEHLSEPEKAIAEIARVLKKGGQAVIATPDYSKWLWHIAEKFTPYKEEHCFKFTKGKLEKMCARYGLTPVQSRYIAWCDLCELFVKK